MKRKNTNFLSNNQQIGIAPCLFELNGQAPTEIKLTPAGLFKAKDGRPFGLAGWVMSDDNAQAVIAASASLQDQLLIDYEHQTLYSRENGQPSPAAAWFKNLEWRAGDGLYATDVDWTAAAKVAIESKEYRYISPVLSYNKKTGEVTGIVMAALVNYPAIDGLTDLAAAHFNFNHEQGFEAMASKLGSLLSRLMQEKNISSEQMGKAAGINAGTVTQILDGSIKRPPERRLQGFASVLGVSLETIKNSLPEETVNEKLKALLKLADNASDDDVLAACKTLQLASKSVETLTDEIAALKANIDANPDPAKFVPVETMTALQNQVAALSNQVNDKQCGDLITAALSDGRILDAQKDWAESLDIAALTAYLKDAQPIAALKGTQTRGKDIDVVDENGLTANELAVCSATGIDIEEFKKSNGEK